MAANNPNQINFQALVAPQIAQQQAQLALQQQLANNLMQEGQTPVDINNRQIGGVAYHVSPFEYLNKMGQTLAGYQANKDVTNKEIALAQQYAQAMRPHFAPPGSQPGAVDQNGNPVPVNPNAAGGNPTAGGDMYIPGMTTDEAMNLRITDPAAYSKAFTDARRLTDQQRNFQGQAFQDWQRNQTDLAYAKQQEALGTGVANVYLRSTPEGQLTGLLNKPQIGGPSPMPNNGIMPPAVQQQQLPPIASGNVPPPPNQTQVAAMGVAGNAVQPAPGMQAQPQIAQNLPEVQSPQALAVQPPQQPISQPPKRDPNLTPEQNDAAQKAWADRQTAQLDVNKTLAGENAKNAADNLKHYTTSASLSDQIFSKLNDMHQANKQSSFDTFNTDDGKGPETFYHSFMKDPTSVANSNLMQLKEQGLIGQIGQQLGDAGIKSNRSLVGIIQGSDDLKLNAGKPAVASQIDGIGKNFVQNMLNDYHQAKALGANPQPLPLIPMMTPKGLRRVDPRFVHDVLDAGGTFDLNRQLPSQAGK